jgi:predicted DNA-binding transcriptional regulator AlpA
MKPLLIDRELKKQQESRTAELSEFLSERQLGNRLGVGVVTLRRWRWEGREMPKSIRLGRLVRYPKTEVDSWIKRVVSGEVRAGSRNA